MTTILEGQRFWKRGDHSHVWIVDAIVPAKDHRPAFAVLISKANAGMPEWHGAELHYSGSPDVMAAHAHRQRAAGVQIIGGCCGSSPEHIAMMRRVLDGDTPVPEVEFEVAVVRQVPKGRARTGRRTERPKN